jgi:hypothetical protein
MSAPHWAPDDDLDPATREALTEFTMPRIGPDGRPSWPADEVPGVLAPEPFPAAWEREIERQEDADPDEDSASTEPTEQDSAAHEQTIADEVQRRQAARRTRQTVRQAPSTTSRSRWWYVRLPALFEDAGNRLYPKPNGTVETGHQPCHGSRSGRCVVVDPAKGVFWCRSCRTGGDAVTLLQQFHGWTRPQAVQHLTQQYGAAKPGKRQLVSRPQRVLEA